MVKNTNSIEQAFEEWEEECDNRFSELFENEKRINELFINLYALDGKIDPIPNDREISIRKADRVRDIKSFISYAVGCMFGRYSLDIDGLIYTGGELDCSVYKRFPVDRDNVIPICDDEYFSDDIVGLFVKFVECVYGSESLESNLKYIADSLNGKGSPREVIREYFLSDFYVDHCATYSYGIYGKRPIYWMFDSGKRNAFKCLVYLHRYKSDTIARIRTDYVHEQQARYKTAIEEIENRIDTVSGSEKVKLTKKLNNLKDQDEEIHAYEEKIHHLADQMISIDLDDGVKHNYDLFKDVLAKIK